jgi:hypothetical protein
MGTTVCKMWLQTTSGKNSQIAKWQINGRLICRHHWFVNTLGQGRIQGGGGAPGAPLKLEKIWFFGAKSWFFTRNTPNIFAPPTARRNFFKCATLAWNPGSAPDALHGKLISNYYQIENELFQKAGRTVRFYHTGLSNREEANHS